MVSGGIEGHGQRQWVAGDRRDRHAWLDTSIQNGRGTANAMECGAYRFPTHEELVADRRSRRMPVTECVADVPDSDAWRRVTQPCIVKRQHYCWRSSVSQDL